MSAAREAVFICGSTCDHAHDSLNGPTGCCSEHGPYMYFCETCNDAARIARTTGATS